MLKKLIHIKMWKKSTFIITSILISMLLVGMTAGALWQFNQQNASTVNVRGYGIKLFKDLACTVPLLSGDTLSYGDVFTGESSVPINIYAKNIATESVFTSLSRSNTSFPTYLTLKSGTKTITDVKTPLYTPAGAFGLVNPVSALTTPGLITYPVWTQVATLLILKDTASTPNGMDASQFKPSGFSYIKVDNEIIKVLWPVVVSGATSTATVVRAQCGTAAAIHYGNTPITIGTWNTEPVQPPAIGLAPGAILTIPLHLECAIDTGGEFSIKNFTTIIDSATTPLP